MNNSFHIACNQQAQVPNAYNLSTRKPNQNVTIEIQNLCEKLIAHVPSILYDLCDIASFVFVADQMASRGGDTNPRDGV